MTIPFSHNKSLKVINLLGGPGVGKSTTAADLFAKMKRAGYKVELIHEIAKDFVWEKWDHIFREQDYIFAHQHRLQRRLVGHDIEYVIVDSSLLLGLFYMPDDFPTSFAVFVREVFDSYDNINIRLERSNQFEYVQAGRNQDEAQARAIDDKVRQYLITEQIPYIEVVSGDQSAFDILAAINTPQP